ncbi:MAG: prolyl oligopeptidase family serine peptidase [Petrimonas sp.]|nr:prolyl oligopeptidase family serine peptidase [Petrimonas sp.]
MKTFFNTLCFLLVISCTGTQTFDYPKTRTVDASDNYFGTVVSDPYRWLEDMNNPEVMKWFKSQADFTNRFLDEIPGRNKILEDIEELTNMEGDIIRKPYKSGSYYYFTKIMKGETFGNLYRRDIKTGIEEVFFKGQEYKKGTQIIDYVANNRDNLMAVKIQDEGSELCEIIFLKLPDKTILKDKLYPIWSEFDVNFSPDGRALVYTQMVTSDPNSEELLKNMKAKIHIIGTDPAKDRVLASAADNADLNILPERFPKIFFSPDNQYIFLALGAATNYLSAFYAETRDLFADKIPWKPLIKEEDQISNFGSFGNQLFFLTFKDAPNFKIGVTDIQNPDFEKAKTIVPNGDETITSLDISKNYLFFAKSNGITQNLYRIDPKNNEIHKIETPGGVNLGFSINGMESDEIAIINSNWLSPDYFLEYDLARQQPAIKSSWLNSDSRFPDFSRLYDIKEIEVPGHDGVMIPLSIVFPKNIKLDGSTPCFITGYGGYGYSFYPFFLGEEIAFLQQGGMIAIAHVRGGGEKGEEWHQAGMKADKPNTWKDFISCAEYLIRAKYTSARKITGEGASAGGILIGRAITERPDLFAVAINIVGMTQTLRNEVTANGDNQIPEIGSVKNKEDIDALIEMDVQSKIRKGVKYPAVLTITGINDSRVVPWMPAKFTAALQANSTSGKPVLLSVNYKAGHGVNDIKDYQKLLADMFSFALWQTGP